MKVGDIKNLVYTPGVGIVEEGSTMDETMKRISHLEAMNEIRDKREKRKLQRENPGCQIVKFGNEWCVIPQRSRRNYP